MKKVFVLMFLVSVLLIAAAPAWADEYGITVTLNDKAIEFPDQKPYIDQNNRTLVPVRFVSEALGAQVDWDGKTQTVTITRSTQKIVLKIWESKALVNGETVTFDTRAVITGDRTMVPLRFISETLGATVTWAQESKTVKISTLTTSDLKVDIPDPKNNPYKVDISFIVLLEKPLEPQYKDAETILTSRVGAATTKEIMDYIKQKTNPEKELENKWWTVNGKKIVAGSDPNSWDIAVTVWNK